MKQLKKEDEYIHPIDVVADMIVIADSMGLLVEVVWVFGNNQSGGLNAYNSATQALAEWDI